MEIDKRINGNTKIIGIIGNPIEHTKSPLIHNTLSREFKDNFIYVPMKVNDLNIKEAIFGIKALNFVGINVTVPYKSLVIDLLDDISKEAGIIGAVNTIKLDNGKLIGYNTDGDGFIRAFIEETKSILKGKIVTLLGAGGSTRSIAVKLAFSGVEKINIVNRTIQKALNIADNINSLVKPDLVYATKNNDSNIGKIINESDVIVNTTSLGMYPNIENYPLDEKINFSKQQIVYDIIYNPLKTKLLKKAENAGCKIINGTGMLFYQGIEAYKIWSGRYELNSNLLNRLLVEFKKNI